MYICTSFLLLHGRPTIVHKARSLKMIAYSRSVSRWRLPLGINSRGLLLVKVGLLGCEQMAGIHVGLGRMVGNELIPLLAHVVGLYKVVFAWWFVVHVVHPSLPARGHFGGLGEHFTSVRELHKTPLILVLASKVFVIPVAEVSAYKGGQLFTESSLLMRRSVRLSTE